jgi:hypothetical protein
MIKKFVDLCKSEKISVEQNDTVIKQILKDAMVINVSLVRKVINLKGGSSPRHWRGLKVGYRIMTSGSYFLFPCRKHSRAYITSEKISSGQTDGLRL